MSGHTPGPWFAATLRTHGADPKMNGCDICADNGANVALVLYRKSEHTEAETVANARLVAHALEMLIELQRVYEHLYNPFEPDNQSEHYKRIGALIALVTGTPND